MIKDLCITSDGYKYENKLAKSIADCSWYELTRQLEYKAEWNYRQYIKVNTFFQVVSYVDTVGIKIRT